MINMHVKIYKIICFHNFWKYYTYTEKIIGHRKSCTSIEGVDRHKILPYKLKYYSTIF